MDSTRFLPTHILVPTDFSGYAHQAFICAVNIASTCHSKVLLLHVIDEQIAQSVIDYFPGETEGNKAIQRKLEATIDRLWHEIDSISDNAPEVGMTCEARQGIPYDEILKEQQKSKIDLIVMASLGRTGIVNSMIGGVAEKVLRGAKCPVMLIRN